MRHASLTIINDEHQALAAMLRSLSMLLAQSRREQKMPSFELLRAMLFYIDEFPERLHHTKETQLLFPRLRERCPDLVPVLDALDADHAQGERAIRELEHALLAFEMMGETRREAFEAAAERYVNFYLAHMGTEENLVLPAAEKHLLAEDWAELDAEFEANRDPLTGHEPDQAYRPLFTRILNMAPAPIGARELRRPAHAFPSPPTTPASCRRFCLRCSGSPSARAQRLPLRHPGAGRDPRMLIRRRGWHGHVPTTATPLRRYAWIPACAGMTARSAQRFSSRSKPEGTLFQHPLCTSRTNPTACPKPCQQ